MCMTMLLDCLPEWDNCPWRQSASTAATRATLDANRRRSIAPHNSTSLVYESRLLVPERTAIDVSNPTRHKWKTINIQVTPSRWSIQYLLSMHSETKRGWSGQMPCFTTWGSLHGSRHILLTTYFPWVYSNGAEVQELMSLLLLLFLRLDAVD